MDCSTLPTRTVAALLVTAAVASSPATAQSFFDDFNDAADDGWTRYDPLGTGTFSAAGGAYRLSGPAGNTTFQRLASIAPIEIFADGQVSVELLHVIETPPQRMSILARAQSTSSGFSGYILGYNPISEAYPGESTIGIYRLTNDVWANISGPGGNFPRDLARVHRMVFNLSGSTLIGAIYDVADPATPLAIVGATDSTHVNPGLAGITMTPFRANRAHEVDGTFDTFRVGACPADFNDDGAVDSDDFFDFLNAYSAGDSRSDFNRDGAVDSDDFFDFLNAFYTGC